jgi:protocatechuate 3,4-dioxygenase, alpha subunit
VAEPLGTTPSQTVGPFFGFALPYEAGPLLVPLTDPDTIRIEGVVRDGNGDPVPDALIEIWQANRSGRYAHPNDDREELPLEEGFVGFGRCGTDPEGRYWFATVKPGRVPGPDGTMQAPHIAVNVLARGLLRHLPTRIYFPDEAEANAADPVLASIEDEAARETLIAREDGGVLRFDIRLQGDGETVFFDV